ncbi:hypothetical protein MKW92_025478 [Papaver armeniacum]|nr:hypothetical protein MKW92_025478 [Papaver armeniacum]
MFLLYEYDIFWTFLIISTPTREGPEKLSSYESGIEPMGDAWLQFRIRYYMFALVFVVRGRVKGRIVPHRYNPLN